MKIFEAADRIPLAGERPAATLGVFDGVHRGHRAIIEILLAAARKLSIPTLALTFHPHPRAALGLSVPPGICSLKARLRLLEEAGLDAVWILPFSREMSLLSGREFAAEFLFHRLAVRAVVMGGNAVFGRGRDGDAHSLALWAAGRDILVSAVPPLPIHGAIISSTAVRLAVQM
ncbi:MAG: hypothetical protein LBE84_05290, partial [Planctomycetota bacterium]|nr:hypothetical protein [Planctomycetota bacterium]